MTHDDRSTAIEKVKWSLKNHEHFCLVSTSLIEAGVDLDFNMVFRELAGLDNLLQTAGRCNREGRKTGCKTYAFEFEDEELRPKSSEFSIKQTFCRNVFNKFSYVTSMEAVLYYFDQLYAYTLNDMNSMDFKKAISNDSCGIDGIGFDFAAYARDFRLIDDNTQPLVIVTDENRKIVKYTKAFNYLTDTPNHKQQLDDMTLLCWAMTKESEKPYIQMFNTGIGFFHFNDGKGAEAERNERERQEKALVSIFNQLAQGKEADWKSYGMDGSTQFYILGVKPNSSRLAIKIFGTTLSEI